MNDNTLSMDLIFPTYLYRIKVEQFLDNVLTATNKALDLVYTEPLNELYPVYHTHQMRHYEELANFVNYVGLTGWKILDSQGYQMDDKEVYFEAMWCQEHRKTSGMDVHVHPNNACQLVGFYVIGCDEEETKRPVITVYDPKPAKIQIGLDNKNLAVISPASNSINYKVEPGLLVFTNAWVPHSISRNPSEVPFKVMHFNIGVRPVTPKPFAQPAEVI